MKGRLLLAALAVTSLASCSKAPTTGPRAFLVEKDGRQAIAIEHGKKIEFYPLPADAQVVVDGQARPLGGKVGSAALGITPRCPCNIPDCLRFCHPGPSGGTSWFELPVRDPRTLPVDPPPVDGPRNPRGPEPVVPQPPPP